MPVLLIGRQRMNGWNASGFDRMYKEFRAGGASVATGNGTLSSGPNRASDLAVGDVLAAKIANVSIRASAATDAAVVTVLSKGEGVVVLRLPEGDFVEVQAAGGAGYVDHRLVK